MDKTTSFRDQIAKFKHTEPTTGTSPRKRSATESNSASEASTPKKLKSSETKDSSRSKKSPGKPKVDYHSLPPLTDCIADDLDVLFCGYNPGIQSATKQHHFAGGGNHFWPCLSEAGFGNGAKLTYEDDNDCPRLYNFGITNLVERCTPGSADLTPQEMQSAVAPLKAKILKYKPKIVAFIGKDVYRHFVGKAVYNGGKNFTWGLQTKKVSYADSEKQGLIYVIPGTSGRVSAYQKGDKLEMFVKLRKIVEGLKEGRDVHSVEEEAAASVVDDAASVVDDAADDDEVEEQGKEDENEED
ncbi:hypothetical protein SmJEL517_g00540 [Synchytrium microbalum]|uniref:Uracil-DNA glycosylase-like domain-containing protein n=1 Tax=Synchytrium microbalum TaxID=1806994 RepID=A0A507CIK3_9FUNG|nr:uncharacterized protein SmJEL517_g00540 [Synchytrium microbalum]TPX37493.1 hypothetical protein SmJEL517_g00540 [Synchytrium microbalum]